MSFLASFALVCTLLPQAPQGGPDGTAAAKGAQGQGLLTPAERAGLRDKLVKYLVEDAAYSLSTGKEREKASKAAEKARNAFSDDWSKAEKKGALASMVDLRAVFENCFSLKPPTISLGQLRAEKTKGSDLEYSFYLPKNYKATSPSRTIWVLPGTTDTKGDAWTKPADYFAATWDKSATSADTIFHLPMARQGIELDPVPDFSREASANEEQSRIDWMWGSFAELIWAYNIERSKLFLDCGRGSCGFGLRFVTMFPDRFAGVILRAPVAVDDIRLGSLRDLPVLLLRTGANTAVVDALAKRLEEIGAKPTTLDAKDEYPHKGHTTDIETWLADKRRTAVPNRVVIEPNHDKFNQAYWADIEVADSLVTAQPDKKPRLECEADRAANRITVKTVGIERFTIFLNDDLVDLDKEFTVVINDKAVTEKKTRNFRDLRERMIKRRDWEFLFPVAFTSNVPK